MKDGKKGKVAFIAVVLGLVVIIAAIAAIFAFGLDKLAAFRYHKLTYKVEGGIEALDYPSGYSRRSGTAAVAVDARAFTLYAFLEGVAGYSTELGAAKSAERDALAKDVKTVLAGLPPLKVKRWKDFYEAHRLGVYPYLYYTMALGSPPQFLHVTPKDELAQDTFFSLAGFRDILREFYADAGIGELYAKHMAAGHFAMADRYDPAAIAAQQKFLHDYIGIKPPPATGNLVTVVPMPYESHYVAYSLTYGKRSYLVDGPDSNDYGLNWHEYLHVFVNPIVESAMAGNRQSFVAIFNSNRSKRYVTGSYERLETFVAENLIRAMDHRIQLAYAPDWSKASLKSKIDAVEADELINGFALIPYFAIKVQEFEKDGARDLTAFITSSLGSYGR